MRNFIATIALLFLAGCASTGVRVAHVALPGTYSIPPGLTFDVQAEHEPTGYAARQALGVFSLVSDKASAPSSNVWRLRADAFVAMETTRSRDPFCDRRWYMYDRWWYDPYYYHFGPRYPIGCSRFPERIQTYPVRTITWTVQGPSGQVLWQASASEARPAGPPVELSMRLARSLDQWLSEGPR